jgi:hypothetical protein
MADYVTWYEFKKDLEKETGRTLLNTNWFEVKPFEPLPWNRTHLQESINKLGQIRNLKSDRRLVNIPAETHRRELVTVY